MRKINFGSLKRNRFQGREESSFSRFYRDEKRDRRNMRIERIHGGTKVNQIDVESDLEKARRDMSLDLSC